MEGLITSNAYVQYESPISSALKVYMAINVKYLPRIPQEIK